jgi:putative transposase
MILTEQHIIKKSDDRYKELDNLLYLSKNLYNAGLYIIRQYFFEHKKFLNYQSLTSIMVKQNNVDYRQLPAKVSQQTLKLIEQNFKSFFNHLKVKKPNEIVKIPDYLKKDTGRFVVTYTNQAISTKSLKKGVIKLSKVNSTFKSNKQNIQQVRIVPKNNTIVIEILYKVEESINLGDNKRYASIDLGVNNLATLGSSVIKPIIINGRPLKSINQYYNKRVAKLKSKLKAGKKTSKRIKSLTDKRNNKVKDYLHKASTIIVNHLVSNDLNTLIIGKNKSWKQDINIGKKNNQNFVQIPHATFISMLEYKCKLKGITTILTEESYTSKCSFLDDEPIKKQTVYKGLRIKRGLFKSSNGTLINADQNGSLNILKKVVGKFNYNPIEVCSTPSVITVKFN